MPIPGDSLLYLKGMGKHLTYFVIHNERYNNKFQLQISLIDKIIIIALVWKRCMHMCSSKGYIFSKCIENNIASKQLQCNFWNTFHINVIGIKISGNQLTLLLKSEHPFYLCNMARPSVTPLHDCVPPFTFVTHSDTPKANPIKCVFQFPLACWIM